MEFWKKHTKCRIILMAALFIAGISLSVFGWGMTGKMTGLGIMLIGIICLIALLQKRRKESNYMDEIE